MKHRRFGSQGFSLLEVTVVGGLLMIVALGLSSIISTMNTQSLSLQQKMDMAEIKARLERTFINFPNVCGSTDWPIIGLTFSPLGVTSTSASADAPAHAPDTRAPTTIQRDQFTRISLLRRTPVCSDELPRRVVWADSRNGSSGSVIPNWQT